MKSEIIQEILLLKEKTAESKSYNSIPEKPVCFFSWGN